MFRPPILLVNLGDTSFVVFPPNNSSCINYSKSYCILCYCLIVGKRCDGSLFCNFACFLYKYIENESKGMCLSANCDLLRPIELSLVTSYCCFDFVQPLSQGLSSLLHGLKERPWERGYTLYFVLCFLCLVFLGGGGWGLLCSNFIFLNCVVIVVVIVLFDE